jgi:hypothetical protein
MRCLSGIERVSVLSSSPAWKNKVLFRWLPFPVDPIHRLPHGSPHGGYDRQFSLLEMRCASPALSPTYPQLHLLVVHKRLLPPCIARFLLSLRYAT